MMSSEFEHALAELIAVQRTTKNLIEALVDAADIAVVIDAASETSSTYVCSSSSGFTTMKQKADSEHVRAHVWVILLLCWVILVLL